MTMEKDYRGTKDYALEKVGLMGRGTCYAPSKKHNLKVTNGT
jgi:hypothetical protein